MKISHQQLAGILWLLTALACFATLDTGTKWVTQSLPLALALWYRYLFNAVAVTVVVGHQRQRQLWRTAHPKFHVVRGVLLFLTSLFAFLSLKYLPVAEFTAIVMLTPLLVTLLSARLLGESVSVWRWVLVLGGFVGVLVIVRPGEAGFSPLLLLPLALVVANTAFQLLTSRMTRTEDPLTLQFYTAWVGAILGTLPLPWVWAAVPFGALWLGLIVMGLFGTLGHYVLILAFQRAPAATLAPYMFAQIGFAMLGGWIMFAHIPDGWAVVGMALVALCGVIGAWLTLREYRQKAVSLQPDVGEAEVLASELP